MIYFKVERGQGNVLRHFEKSWFMKSGKYFCQKEENILFGVHIYRSATIYNHLENIVLTSLDISDLVSYFRKFRFSFENEFPIFARLKKCKKITTLMLSEFRAWFNNFSGKCEIATTDRSSLTFMGFEIYLFKSFIQVLLTIFYNEKI